MKYLREVIKAIVLGAYVYAWAPVRNYVRGICGQCHTTVLVYHRVNDEYKDDVSVGVEQFREHLQVLCEHYEVSDMAKFLAGRTSACRKPRVVITFDDGYEDNHGAAEILHQRKLPCTFFVCTRIIGTNKPFPHDASRLGKVVPSLDWSQVDEMASWGFHFSPHTANHLNLATLTREQATAEIAVSRDDLVEQLGEQVSAHWFAYPHGRAEDMPGELRKILPGMGINYCFSGYGGVNLPRFDPLNVLRQAINHRFSRLAFRAAVEGWRVRVPRRKRENVWKSKCRDGVIVS